MRLNVLYHDNCFDGSSSAAVFLRFYREKMNPQAEISLVGMAHQAGDQFHEELFSGDENAIVDFKYASTSRLTWWFDHHHSAFLTPEDEAHFRQNRSGRKFYDPSFKSCTKFIYQIAHQQFGFDCPMLDELVSWADVIDGAQYADALTAVEVKAPAQKLAAVIETNKDAAFLHGIIRQLAYHPLSEVATQKSVLERYEPLALRHSENIRIIQENAEFAHGVIFFDLVGHDAEGYNKFIPYYLYPEATYSVSVMSTPTRMKVSVGWNPWSRSERRHNLAAICERYGGGGHPVVAAISFAPSAVDEARRAAKEICLELRNSRSLR
ncbi:MAG: phosphoesterase [Acidobacteriota bacterium]